MREESSRTGPYCKFVQWKRGLLSAQGKLIYQVQHFYSCSSSCRKTSCQFRGKRVYLFTENSNQLDPFASELMTCSVTFTMEAGTKCLHLSFQLERWFSWIKNIPVFTSYTQEMCVSKNWFNVQFYVTGFYSQLTICTLMLYLIQM